MTINDFSPSDRVRFCDEINSISSVKKFFLRINNFLTVRAANRLNKEACDAFNRGDEDQFLVGRYQADCLWSQIYGVKMWRAE